MNCASNIENCTKYFVLFLAGNISQLTKQKHRQIPEGNFLRRKQPNNLAANSIFSQNQPNRQTLRKIIIMKNNNNRKNFALYKIIANFIYDENVSCFVFWRLELVFFAGENAGNIHMLRIEKDHTEIFTIN